MCVCRGTREEINIQQESEKYFNIRFLRRYFLQASGILFSMGAGLCSMTLLCVVENNVKTQASFIEHLGKFTFPVRVCVWGGGGQRETAVSHTCLVVSKILSRHYTVYFYTHTHTEVEVKGREHFTYCNRSHLVDCVTLLELPPSHLL